MKIPSQISLPTDGIAAVGGGAAAGATIQATIGGVGIAATGTAVAAPLVLTGAALGAALYGAYRLGRRTRD